MAPKTLVSRTQHHKHPVHTARKHIKRYPRDTTINIHLLAVVASTRHTETLVDEFKHPCVRSEANSLLASTGGDDSLRGIPRHDKQLRYE